MDFSANKSIKQHYEISYEQNTDDWSLRIFDIKEIYPLSVHSKVKLHIL